MTNDHATTDVLRSLLLGRSVAALATLHDGRPAASMVPFAVTTTAGAVRLVTHVSGLAAHTRDMRVDPAVCLLVTAPETPGVPPQALPRLSIPARAEFIPVDHPRHAMYRAAYLARFPEAADLFGFADFSLVAFEPASVRLVAGFARAITVSVEALAAALGETRSG